MVEGKAAAIKDREMFINLADGDLFPRGGKLSVSDGKRLFFAGAVNEFLDTAFRPG